MALSFGSASGDRFAVAVGKRLAADDLQTVPRQIGEPGGLVGQQNHFAHADVAQDLSADSVVAEIRLGRAQMGARAEVPVAACGDSGANACQLVTSTSPFLSSFMSEEGTRSNSSK